MPMPVSINTSAALSPISLRKDACPDWPAAGCCDMPVAKLSPISQATISITPWMPKVIISDSTGSLVKFRMPSQVVQPYASESTTPVAPKRASCQLEKKTSSMTRPTPLKNGLARNKAKTIARTAMATGRLSAVMPNRPNKDLKYSITAIHTSARPEPRRHAPPCPACSIIAPV